MILLQTPRQFVQGGRVEVMGTSSGSSVISDVAKMPDGVPLSKNLVDIVAITFPSSAPDQVCGGMKSRVTQIRG